MTEVRRSAIARVLNERVRGWLAWPGMAWVAALLSVALSAHSLGLDLILDDHLHRLTLLGLGDELIGRPPTALDLFRFMPGDAAFSAAAKLQGTLPWWAPDDIQLAFWRPLTAASHLLDHRLWPNAIWLMHLHNLLWMFGLVLLAARWFRRIAGVEPWVAGLATLMFALFSGFALPSSWIANRSTLMAELFAVACLLAHDRGVRTGALGVRLAAPGLLAASLLCGEIGLGTVAYLGAWALLLDPRGPRRGLRALWPYALVVIAWRVAYVQLGYGADGSPVYIDPLRSPAVFVNALLERGPVLLLRLLGGPPSHLVAPAGPAAAYVAIACIAVLAIVLAPVLRRVSPTRAALRFAILAALLCCVPACASFVHDRLLCFAALGGSLFAALVIAAALEPEANFGLRALALVWLPSFLVMSPAMLVIDGLSLRIIGAPQLAAAESLPTQLHGRTLFVVNVPEPLSMCAQLPFVLAVQGRELPSALRCLGASEQAVTVRRPNPKTLLLSTEGYGRGTNGQLLSRTDHARFDGFEQALGELRVEVLRTTDDGRPRVVGFYFPDALESERRVWVVWTGEGFERFALPKVGESIELPARGLGEL